MPSKDPPFPVAILCSDIHLSVKVPPARAAEKDWWHAMTRPLNELRDLAERLSVPILCGGDVFDKWNSPPELINFALDHLPEMYAVPGQHDLPFHSFEDLEDCAFGTLVKVGRIKLLESGSPTELPNFIGHFRRAWIWGFPWGSAIEPQTWREDGDLHIAVCHSYIWTGDAGYPGASKDKRLGGYKKQLAGYDVALFGDNHKGFCRSLYYDDKRTKRCVVWNNGGFMRRKSDELDNLPRVGILLSDGNVENHFLDITKDRFVTGERAELIEEATFNMKAFLKELNTLNADPLNFRDSLRRYFDIHEVSKGARDIILKAITHE